MPSVAQSAPLVSASSGASRPAASLYAEFCASCHGATSEGGAGPSLIDASWLRGGSDANIAEAISSGYPERGMPAFGATLSAAEIRALVILIREGGSKGALTAASPQCATAPRQLPQGEIATELHRFRLESVAEGLITPWSLALLPDGRMLVTERPGRLRVIENRKLLTEPVRGVPRTNEFSNEGGFQDVVAHPNYTLNQWIYLSFTDIAPPSAEGKDTVHTKIVRGRVRAGEWMDEQIVWSAPSEFYRHAPNLGGRMEFDDKGFLFFSVGDRLAPDHAQDRASPYGKIHRVHDDGRIPADNPFVNEPASFKSIWTYGHRNPQGLAFDMHTGLMWESEHGPRGGDELNLLHPGGNFGWPVITHGMNYNGTPVSSSTMQDGMEQPIVHWTPSIAVSNLEVYAGDAFANWRGHLFVASLKQEKLLRLETSGRRITHRETILTDVGRLRDVVNGPGGALYLVVNDAANSAAGRILRMAPTDQSRSEGRAASQMRMSAAAQLAAISIAHPDPPADVADSRPENSSGPHACRLTPDAR